MVQIPSSSLKKSKASESRFSGFFYGSKNLLHFFTFYKVNIYRQFRFELQNGSLTYKQNYFTLKTKSL
jgi:hypothetical protein